MKNAFLSALIGLSLVSINLPAKAGEHESDDSSEGCSKEFKAKFCLLPTADAPAGAKGKAEIESETEDGVQAGEMEIKIKGLADGTYTVSVFLASSSNTVDIGQITVGGSTCSDGDDENEDEDNDRDSLQKSDDDHDDGDEDNDDQGEDEDGDGDHHHGDATKVEFALPSDLDPMDIVQVIVSDTNGTPLLVGDLSDSDGGCKATLRADAPVTSGDAAPEAAGTAHLNSKVRKGKVHNRFTLVANNVPPRSTFTIEVNGTEVGTARSNKKGKVLVKKLPKNVSSVGTVRLLDSNGNEVAHTSF